MSIKWCFPSVGRGQAKGLNNSGVETFKDKPIKSLAREICQNSLDATIEGKTAIVEFSTFSILQSDFPDLEGFKAILNGCKKYAEKDNNRKSMQFFDNALQKIDSTKISMLRISDFNTTGLLSKDWERLVEKAGDSNKSGEKIGSFGIGKFAPFACSDFRTVFYSTLNQDGEQRSKGVSTLMSFKLKENPDGSDDLSQDTGFYGEVEEYRINYISKILNIDKTFTRTEVGTDVYISAFNILDKEEFLKRILAEVLDGFLLAIWNEKLEVKINGLIVNKKNLKDILEKYKDAVSQNTILALDLLSDESVKWFDLPIRTVATLPPIGSIKLGFKLRYDGTNKISMVRSSGMKILDRANLCRSFTYYGIGIIVGDGLSKFLRDLESPSHDKWEPDRSKNPSSAKNILKQINDAITQKLNDEAASLFDGEIDIEGAGEYLPDIDETGDTKVNEPNNDFDKIISVETKVIKKARSVAHLETDEVGEDISALSDSDGNATEGEGYEGLHYQGHKPHGHGEKVTEEVGLGEGTDKLKQFISVKAKTIRVICLNKNKRLYRIAFLPSMDSKKAYLEIGKIAEQNEKMPIEVVKILNETLSFNKNRIGYFEMENGKKINIDFQITDDEYSAMEVKVYAYQG